ncbi:hypothetical protein BpHYR1_027625 [Brachionus plicatilis]|uniref:Uncharacterized protein n=1 Tax=Brachionus plicatilis TaxID=10195 RepID=A0A3M7RS58_BRAPC|nr:hypothetical protein BpHYR1_027625 [Brachionus plicatilis]
MGSFIRSSVYQGYRTAEVQSVSDKKITNKRQFIHNHLLVNIFKSTTCLINYINDLYLMYKLSIQSKNSEENDPFFEQDRASKYSTSTCLFSLAPLLPRDNLDSDMFWPLSLSSDSVFFLFNSLACSLTDLVCSSTMVEFKDCIDWDIPILALGSVSSDST